MVEIKESYQNGSITQSFSLSTLPSPEHAVEIVEIIDAESIESIPDRDTIGEYRILDDVSTGFILKREKKIENSIKKNSYGNLSS